ncbi:hypothetical protein CBOM_03914 [Ceraceosorus bombacis]|uniref:Uncharacterized protein n=1 Tax=Ceraceosorus bombacis TaxID=401625 RepID=A0A0P1BN11_9BASI|nr:hypothetical protein CBOM_03914 [Ceraceosorus bombacis]
MAEGQQVDGKSEELIKSVQDIESVKPDEIRYAQKQWYKIGSFEKIMDSTVVMKLDKDGRIVHFQDRWGRNEIGSNPVTYIFRRLNAVTLPLFVSIPEGGKAHKDL